MKPIVIANWKMKLGYKESLDLAREVKNGLIKKERKSYDRFIGVNNRWAKNLDVALCPSCIALSGVKKIISNTGISLGAQNVFWEEKGAYTGEISASQLKELGVKYVLIGHSERRSTLGETDEMVHKKMRLALDAKLIPILCIGETFEERQAHQTDHIIVKKLIAALEGIDIKKDQHLIIAYEPAWVIGFKAGKSMEPAEADLSAKIIRQSLLGLFSQEFINTNVNIIYGASVSSNDAQYFLKQPNINGLLVGTCSLNANEFLKIIGNSFK